MKQFGTPLKVFVVFLFIMLLAPLVVVIGVSFNSGSDFSVDFNDMSLRWYRAFFESTAFSKALFQISFPVAIVASIFATVIGALSAIAIARFNFPGRMLVETCLMLPLLVPSILLGAALYLFFTRVGSGGSLVSMMIGHILLGIPYVVRNVTAGLAGISPNIEEAAMSLGCTPTKAFLKATLPLLRSSLLSGAIFAFMVSFSDINLALFVAGPETTTMPLQIFSEIMWQGDPTVAAASAIQIFLVCGLVFFVQKIFRVRLTF